MASGDRIWVPTLLLPVGGSTPATPGILAGGSTPAEAWAGWEFTPGATDTITLVGTLLGWGGSNNVEFHFACWTADATNGRSANIRTSVRRLNAGEVLSASFTYSTNRKTVNVAIGASESANQLRLANTTHTSSEVDSAADGDLIAVEVSVTDGGTALGSPLFILSAWGEEA